jgi:hypothetical protein
VTDRYCCGGCKWWLRDPFEKPAVLGWCDHPSAGTLEVTGDSTEIEPTETDAPSIKTDSLAWCAGWQRKQ